MMTDHARGVSQYRTDTLESILRDLRRNPQASRRGSWENSRMKAIEKELNKRKNAV
jgi:hypothetical protein